MRPKLLSTFLVVGILLAATYFYVHRPIQIEKEPIILGHGGMGTRSIFPLDSEASIKQALSYPIGGTELDVKITSDHVLVAFHDAELGQNTDCNGHVATMPADELLQCENSTWFRSEPIADLNELLSLNWKAGTVFSFDLKPDPEVTGDLLTIFIERITQTILDHPDHRFLIESQDIGLLRMLKQQDTGAELFYYAGNARSDVQLALENKLDGISIDMRFVTEQDVTRIKGKGLQVMLWGTGSVFDNRKALHYRPDLIQTDDIRSMVRILNRD